MTEKKFIAHARVVVTLEVSDVGTWGTTCTVEQTHRQAAESAIGRIKKMIHDTKQFGMVNIIGDVVTGILTEDIK
jgi:hypothetical protein